MNARKIAKRKAWLARKADEAKATEALASELVKAKDANAVEAVLDAIKDDLVQCRAGSGVALASQTNWKQDEPVQFIYAPEGIHTITAGFRDGRITMTVVVDENTPQALQASFKNVSSRRQQTPFGDEEHEAHKATLRFPKDSTRFEWGKVKDSTGVVVCGGLPTSYGASVVNGKVYEAWSPEFLTDAEYSKAHITDDGHYTFPDGVKGSASNPARLVGVGFTIGALTNKPAFWAMPPVKARQAGAGMEVKAVETEEQRKEAAKLGWQKKVRFHTDRSEEHAKNGSDQKSIDAHKISATAYEEMTPEAHFHARNAQRDAGIRAQVMGRHTLAKEHGIHEEEHGQLLLSTLVESLSNKGHDISEIKDSSGALVAFANRVGAHKLIRASDASGQSREAVKAAMPGLDFARLACLPANLQLAHWAADTVTNAHKALGELYSSISELVDDFAEAYAGKTGSLPTRNQECEVCLVATDEELFDTGMSVIEECREKVGGDDDLLNILADMEGAYSKARYLLKANDASDQNGADVKATWSPAARQAALEARRSKSSGMGDEDEHEMVHDAYHELREAGESHGHKDVATWIKHIHGIRIHPDKVKHHLSDIAGVKMPASKHADRFKPGAAGAGGMRARDGSKSQFSSIQSVDGQGKDAYDRSMTLTSESDSVQATWSPEAREATLKVRRLNRHAQDGDQPLKEGDKLHTHLGTTETFSHYNEHGQVITKERGTAGPWHHTNVSLAASDAADTGTMKASVDSILDSVHRKANGLPATDVKPADRTQQLVEAVVQAAHEPSHQQKLDVALDSVLAGQKPSRLTAEQIIEGALQKQGAPPQTLERILAHAGRAGAPSEE